VTKTKGYSANHSAFNPLLLGH